MNTIKVLSWIGAVWSGIGLIYLLPELGTSEDSFWGLVLVVVWGMQSIFTLHYFSQQGKK